jgi:hypothetical protein
MNATGRPKCEVSQGQASRPQRSSRLRCMFPAWAAARECPRLLHHANVIQIEGSSDRLCEHAGLLPETVRLNPHATANPSPPRPEPRFATSAKKSIRDMLKRLKSADTVEKAVKHSVRWGSSTCFGEGLEGLFGRLGRHPGRYAASISGSLLIGLRRTSRLRFWAVAARRNSSLAPFGPLKRRRARRRILLRCANSVSTFFRRRQASTYCGVAACARAMSRASSCRSPRDLAGKSVRAALWFESAGVAIRQPLCHAALNDALEHMTQQIALAKAAMPILRERRVIGNLAIQTESAEPSVREIEMNLLAEPPLGPDAHAVADDQHSDHQLKVNRGPSNPAVKGLQRV